MRHARCSSFESRIGGRPVPSGAGLDRLSDPPAIVIAMKLVLVWLVHSISEAHLHRYWARERSP